MVLSIVCDAMVYNMWRAACKRLLTQVATIVKGKAKGTA